MAPTKPLLKTLATLKGGDLIITRNKRQAAVLMQQWTSLQSDAVLTSIPQILPIQTWIDNAFNNHCSNKVLSHSELTIICQHLLAQLDIDPHMDLENTTKLMLEAWHHLMQWQIPLKALHQFAGNHSSELFNQFAALLTDYLTTHHALTSSQLAEQLRLLIESNNLALPKHCYLYGFIQWTPAEQKLLHTVSESTSLTALTVTPLSNTVQGYVFEQTHEEYAAMAHWAWQQYQHNPHQTVLCIVPDLQSSKTHITQAFTAIDMQATKHINMSGGEHLVDTPLWSAALQFLKLPNQQVPYKKLAHCLKQPFWGNNSLQGCIAKDQLIETIYNNHYTHQTLKNYLQYLLHSNKQNLQQSWLQQWLSHFTAKTANKQSYQQWMQYFCDLLQNIGWPGTETLTSEAYQEYESIKKLWLAYSQLDHILPACTYQQALSALITLSKQTLFAAESQNKPIQILGALEAQFFYADHIWMMHMTDKCWPPIISMNPFLAYSLQKHYQLPGANLQQTHDYYSKLTAQLWHQANDTITSYARHDNNQLQSPSVFMQQITQQAFQLPKPNTPGLKDSVYFAQIVDQMAPPLPQTTIPGGSYGYQAQAQCPFQFMAHYRLQSSNQQQPYLGYDAADRGSLVHETLANFWQHIKDSKTLHQLDDTQLDEAITQAIQQSITKQHNIFEQAETERLFLLIKQWILLEKERPPFTVANIEQTITYQTNGLSSKMRVDRVDQLEDNNTLVIDYKTSKQASTLGWFDDRLTSPQIPLYLLSMSQANAACLALVKRGDPKMLGMANTDLQIKGIKDVADYTEQWSWPALKKQWAEQIEQLSLEIKQGFAAVMPDATSSPCDYCDLNIFCRVQHD